MSKMKSLLRCALVLVMLMQTACHTTANNIVTKPSVTAESKFLSAVQIADNTWQISGCIGEKMYLILGEKSAVLFDTGTGVGDLRAVVKQITDLPLMVVNSHFHTDHTGGNGQFDKTYISAEDYALFERTYKDDSYKYGIAQMSGLELADIEPFLQTVPKTPQKLDIEKSIDLGNRTLEIVPTPGHTAGSISLIDKNNKLAFIGDFVIPGGCWVFLKESSPLSVYEQALGCFADMIDDGYAVWTGHDTTSIGKCTVKEMEGCTEKIRQGQINYEAVDTPCGPASVAQYKSCTLFFNADKLS